MATAETTKNLIPQNKRTKEEQRAISRMGGLQSGRVRKERANVLKLLKILAKEKVTDADGEERTRAEVLALKLWEGGMNGNVAMVKELLDRMYGKPAQTVDMQSSDGSMTPTVVTPVSFEQWKKSQDE